MPALYHPQRHIVPHLAELAGHEEVTLTLYCRAIRLGRSARLGYCIVCHRRPGPNVPYQLYYAYISHDHIRSRGARFVCVRSPISSPRPSLRPSSARRTRDTTTSFTERQSRHDSRVTSRHQDGTHRHDWDCSGTPRPLELASRVHRRGHGTETHARPTRTLTANS